MSPVQLACGPVRAVQSQRGRELVGGDLFLPELRTLPTSISVFPKESPPEVRAVRRVARPA